MDAIGSAQPDADVSCSATTTFVEVIFPEHANHYGTLFGGAALSLMGKAAFVAATRHARRPVVMASSEKAEFHSPVRLGELVELSAQVTRVGRSSMTVKVAMTAEDLMTGARRLAAQSAFEMVAVNADGRPIPAPASHSAEEHGS